MASLIQNGEKMDSFSSIGVTIFLTYFSNLLAAKRVTILYIY